MNYYPHHIGDFNNSTRHLTRIERSIYRDMIELYYDTEQPLLRDVKALCRRLLARTEEEVTAVEQVLNEFFTETEQGWFHDRCDEEIQKYHANISNKSAAGKASAEARAAARAASNKGFASNSTDVEQPLNTRATNQEPRTNNQEPDIKKPSAPKAAQEMYPQEFEQVWSEYPKRPGASKKDSFKAWNARLKAGVPASDILQGVRNYASYVKTKGTEPDFIKQPATFFGPDEHYKADWTVHPAAQKQGFKGQPAADNFAALNYGQAGKL